MFLKRVLNQPNLVGSMLIALMVCAGFVYAVGFDGFNVETATGGEVEAWLEAASSGGSGNSYTCDNSTCKGATDTGANAWAGCPARRKTNKSNCTGCSKNKTACDRKGCTQSGGKGKPKRSHKCQMSADCPYNSSGTGYCSKGQTSCPRNCTG